MYNGKSISIDNFGGGYCGNLQADQLSINQASNLDNLVILPQGKGLRSRQGNRVTNATNTDSAIIGLGNLYTSAGTEYFVAVTKVTSSASKIYKSTDNLANVSDITGAVSLSTSSNNYIWSFVTFNDVIIGFGGSPTSPDAPFKWTGSGNASALGGTPPSAYGCFTANNRVFAFRTSANPSTIYWTVLGNAEDWTSAGSGSATVGTLNDNQTVTGATVINTNTALIFKENSIYQMILTSAPFPIYPLFTTVGALNKNVIVNVDGEIYFITSQFQMRSTDGEKITEYPRDADDVWASIKGLSTTLQSQIRGFRQKGTDYDWIVWTGLTDGSGGSSGTAIIWDLINKCWLKCTSGYTNVNVSATARNGTIYTGQSDNGFFIQLDTLFADRLSGGSSTDIVSFWQSGWLKLSTADKILQIRKIIVEFTTQASGSIAGTYGYDFLSTTNSFSITMSDASRGFSAITSFLTGRGNAFRYKLSNTSQVVPMKISSIILAGKEYGQKRIGSK